MTNILPVFTGGRYEADKNKLRRDAGLLAIAVDSSPESVALIKFIETACNAHDELLACLEILQNHARCKKLNSEQQSLFNRIESALITARGEA